MNLKEALGLSNTYLSDTIDVAVIGAGHAGCEAAVAAAKLGCRTVLFSLTLDAVANLPCNPSIGGTAKGQLVREIDALGGVMGKIADKCAIQYRMLNSSKGPAVQSPRAQIDRRLYQETMKSYLETVPNLHLFQAEVVNILIETENEIESDLKLGKVSGVVTRNGAIFTCKKVIIATGTYLAGKVFIGEHNYASGPDNSQPAAELAINLRNLGLPLRRFKTGTPVRVNKYSVDFKQMESQTPDKDLWRFSFDYENSPQKDLLPQQNCWLTWTTGDAAEIIRENLYRSPLYSGQIEGIGPRYCPSIEDKIVRFPDKLRHQIFIEPMGQTTAEMYLQGLSSSLPEDVQLKIVHSLPGLAEAVIQRSAYAIEYDCLPPTCLKNDLQTRLIAGLYGAGQFNGTSGYEEAAAQGLVAGINAARACHLQQPLVLSRDQAYIGVLIDDLVTKGTNEPYRMMTSRAEYRLLLRQDNADERLIELGYNLGLNSQERLDRYMNKAAAIAKEIKRLNEVKVTGTAAINDYLAEQGVPALQGGTTLAQLLLRPNMSYEKLAPIDQTRPELPQVIKDGAEIRIKYQGYIALEEKRIEKFRKMERKLLPPEIDYNDIGGLRIEAKQKLSQFRPMSIGQAARISGVSPADISVLLVYLELKRRENHGQITGEEK